MVRLGQAAPPSWLVALLAVLGVLLIGVAAAALGTLLLATWRVG